MIIRALAFTAAICLNVAEAQTVWSTTASTCVPTDPAIKLNTDSVQVASVKHASGKVGEIDLSCPIARFSSNMTEWSLVLTYEDSTGTDTAAFVRARLYRMPLGAANPVAMALANSDSSATTTLGSVLSPGVHPHI